MHVHSQLCKVFFDEEWLAENGCSKVLQQSWENSEQLKDALSQKTDMANRHHPSLGEGRKEGEDRR